ncbi:MAG: MMPL family transporter, partial [Nocardioides sp.]
MGRRPVRVLVLAIVAVIASAGYGAGVFGSLSDGGFEDPSAESSDVSRARTELFGDQLVDVVALYRSDALVVGDPAFAQEVQRITAEVREAGAPRVLSWFETRAPALVSEDRRATRLLITLPGGEDRTDGYDKIAPLLRAKGLTTHLAGPYALFDDANHQVEEDIVRAEAISMPLVFLLSLLVFGSLTAALMPTLVGAVAVAGAFALVRAITEVTEVSVFAINVITLMGMGLAIDYALFIVARFREELASHPVPDREAIADALGTTLATAGRTVFFSGVIVAAALSSLLLFPQVFLKSMGYGGMAAVLVAMVASLTVLPAVLSLLGPRLEWGRIRGRHPRGKRVRGRHAQRAELWSTIAHQVMRRPVLVLVVVTAALIGLASPILGARWGGVDERVLPDEAPSRVAAEVNADLFDGEISTATILVRGLPEAELAGLRTALSAVPKVTAVDVVAQKLVEGEAVVLFEAVWPGRSQVPESQSVVDALRKVAHQYDAEVGGDTALTVDLVDSIGATLPKMALLVGAVMLVLLFIAFGSVVLPLKAVAMNTVSIGASFGVVTWVFQDGHFSNWLGFTSPGYLDVTQPILMVAVLFGLSMDYEVFLLSRVREEWDHLRDNTTAVVAGVQKTGWIITSAALLLSVVIGGFTTSGIVFIKMIGLGMLVAVLLDATVVRALLVPATMRLLGRANWWAPAPLARWWERYGHRAHGGGHPAGQGGAG